MRCLLKYRIDIQISIEHVVPLAYWVPNESVTVRGYVLSACRVQVRKTVNLRRRLQYHSSLAG